MYGRARRLELLKRVGIGAAIIIVVLLVANLIARAIVAKGTNVDFYYLKRYLNEKGFACESLTKSGGTCKYRSNNVNERFVRYDNGFAYLYKNNSYLIEIYHVGGKESIIFNTGSEAFVGYQNLKYNCVYKNNILDEIDKCYLGKDESTILDNKAYIGIINNSLYEVSKIVEASGYDREDLLNKYVWNKK